MADFRGNNFNVFILGLAFMLIFTAFQTCAMVQKIVLEGVKNETNGTDVGDGFISLSLIYVVFAFANWLAPAIVAVLGAKISMVMGASLYVLYIGMFLRPRAWSLYVCSVLLGFGAPILWTGQGNCLTVNSNTNTMGRNSGIFWAMLQCSLVLGNLYVFIVFNEVTQIHTAERNQLFAILLSVCGIGSLLLLAIRSFNAPYERLGLDDVRPDSDSERSSVETPAEMSSRHKAWVATKTSFRMLKMREMQLLAITMVYTGLSLTMFSGVFVTAVGHTAQFGKSATSYLGLCGMLIGAGEILGGGLFGLAGKMTVKHGRDQIVLLGFLVHIAAYCLMFLFLPETSPWQITNEATYLPTNKYVVFAIAFLLGFGDSSFNTQLYSIIGGFFVTDSASAFALFKFFQSIAAAVAFYYSNVLLLQWQLLILVVLCVCGTISFFVVEWRVTSHPRSQ